MAFPRIKEQAARPPSIAALQNLRTRSTFCARARSDRDRGDVVRADAGGKFSWVERRPTARSDVGVAAMFRLFAPSCETAKVRIFVPPPQVCPSLSFLGAVALPAGGEHHRRSIGNLSTQGAHRPIDSEPAEFLARSICLGPDRGVWFDLPRVRYE